MKRRYCLDGIAKEQKYVDARIVDSPYGSKMIIPIFNETVPSHYKGNAMRTVETFINAYSLSCGMALNPENIYVDGNLSVYLDRKIPADRRYRLYVVIIIDGGEDYVIEIPVLPEDIHFAEFIQCILNVFKSMIGIG